MADPAAAPPAAPPAPPPSPEGASISLESRASRPHPQASRPTAPPSLGDELLAAAAGEELADKESGETPAEEAKPKPFVFAGIPFESQEKAEQNLRTLRGQFKAAQTKQAAAEQRAADLERRLQDAEQANREWREWHEGGGAAGRQAQPQASQPGEQARAASLLSRIDPTVARQTFDEHGPEGLAQYVAWVSEQHYGGELAASRQAIEELKQRLSQIAPQLEPVVAQHHQQQEAQRVVTLFTSEAQRTLDDGQTPAYPELFDEGHRGMILRILQEYPKDFALTPAGMLNAVAVYREWLRRSGQGAAPGAPAAEPGQVEGQGNGRPRQGSRQSALTGTGAPRSLEPAEDNPIARQLTTPGTPSGQASRLKWVQRGLAS